MSTFQYADTPFTPEAPSLAEAELAAKLALTPQGASRRRLRTAPRCAESITFAGAADFIFAAHRGKITRRTPRILYDLSPTLY